MKRTKRQENLGMIYAVELDGCIKVGFTTNFKSRMRAYRTANKQVDLLWSGRGYMYDEKQFHKHFNKGNEKYDKTDRANLIKNLNRIFLPLNNFDV